MAVMSTEHRDCIAVFAPSPLLTITLEADSGVGDEIHLHAGGQGFWVARMIRSLGSPVVLVAPYGGETGRVLPVLVESEGVHLHGLEVSAPTGAYVDDRRGGERRRVGEMPAGRLSRHEIDDLYNRVLVTGLDARATVLTGQMRQMVGSDDIYRRLAVDLRSNGRLVIADLSGASLDAALAGGVDLVKVSDEELLRTGHVESTEPEQLAQAVERLAAGARTVVLSRAGRPALARLDGRLLELVPPKFEPLDFRGAGDSMTAALAVGLANRMPIDIVLRMAAAAGSLNVMRRGLGTGRPHDIEQLARHIEVRDYEPDESGAAGAPDER